MGSLVMHPRRSVLIIMKHGYNRKKMNRRAFLKAGLVVGGMVGFPTFLQAHVSDMEKIEDQAAKAQKSFIEELIELEPENGAFAWM